MTLRDIGMSLKVSHYLGNRDTFNQEFGLYFTSDQINTVFALFDNLETDRQRREFNNYLSPDLNGVNGVYERYREDGSDGRFSVLPSTFRGTPVYVLVNVDDDKNSNVIGIYESSEEPIQYIMDWLLQSLTDTFSNLPGSARAAETWATILHHSPVSTPLPFPTPSAFMPPRGLPLPSGLSRR